MHAPMIEKNITVLPTKNEAALAEESCNKLSSYITLAENELSLQLVKKLGGKEIISLPPSFLKILMLILSQMAHGNAVTIMPVHAELTTQEAADLLNVSRPFLINLLKAREIPFRQVGAHRRIYAKDVLEYKKTIDEKRLETLADLAEQAQKNSMGY